MNCRCPNCGKEALRVCIHQTCETLPFICNKDCQGNLNQNQNEQNNHIHNKEQLFVSWESITSKVFEIKQMTSPNHKNSIHKRIHILIGSLEELFNRYLKVLIKSNFDIPTDIENIMNKIQNIQDNMDLTGKELSKFKNSQLVKEQRLKCKTQTKLLNKQMFKVLQELQKIDLNKLFNYECSDTYEQFASELLNQNRFNQAIEKFQQARKCNPINYKNVQCIGYCYHQLNKTKEAIEYYTQSLNMGPKNEDLALCYFSLGAIFQTEGKPTKAQKMYSKAIESNQKYSDAYFHRGNTYFKNKNYQEAIKDYTKAIQINSKKVDYFQQRSQAYLKIGKAQLRENDLKLIEELHKNENSTV